MTDEEMTDKYAEKVVKHKMAVHDIFNEIVTKKEIKEAVMYGLKAGRPKWHKVADGDLPKKGVEVLNEDGDKVRYKAIGYSGWIAYSEYEERDVEIDAPVVWCEIPTYTEE